MNHHSFCHAIGWVCDYPHQTRFGLSTLSSFHPLVLFPIFCPHTNACICFHMQVLNLNIFPQTSSTITCHSLSLLPHEPFPYAYHKKNNAVSPTQCCLFPFSSLCDSLPSTFHSSSPSFPHDLHTYSSLTLSVAIPTPLHIPQVLCSCLASPPICITH